MAWFPFVRGFSISKIPGIVGEFSVDIKYHWITGAEFWSVGDIGLWIGRSVPPDCDLLYNGVSPTIVIQYHCDIVNTVLVICVTWIIVLMLRFRN